MKLETRANEPNIAKPSSMEARFACREWRPTSRRSRTIGARSRSWLNTHTAQSTAAPAKSPKIRPEPQPQSLPWESPSIRQMSQADSSPAPMRSGRPPARFPLSRVLTAMSTIATRRPPR